MSNAHVTRVFLGLTAGLVAAGALGACSRELKAPAPTVTSVSPVAICVEQRTSTVAVSGTNFTPIPADTLLERSKVVLPTLDLARTVDLSGASVSDPAVRIPDDPVATETSLVAWKSTSAMSMRLPPSLALKTGLYDLTVTNADGNGATLAGALLAVPRPTLTKVEPDIVCRDLPNELVLTGKDFVTGPGGALPSVKVGGLTLVPEARDCRALPGSGGFSTCTTLVVQLSRQALPLGAASIAVTNPDPVGCLSTDAVALYVQPPPAVDTVEPDLVCTVDTARRVRITGSGFLSITDEGATAARVPDVLLTDLSTLVTATVSAVTPSSCTDVPGPREQLKTCTVLDVELPAGTPAPGLDRVRVANPTPARCISAENVVLASLARPSITGLSASRLCQDATSRELVLLGSGFLVLSDRGAITEVPTVRLEQGATSYVFADATTVRADGCQSIAGVSEEAALCTALAFTLPPDAPVGDYLVSVTNPRSASDCTSAETVVLEVTVPPQIDVNGVQPLAICSSGGALTISGSGFSAGAVATIGGVPSTSVAVTPDATRLTAQWSSASLTSLAIDSFYPVTVDNQDGCSVTAASEVRVTPGIFTYFVDPAVVYDGINTRITLLTSGISARPITVDLVSPATGATLHYGDADVLWDPAKPQRVQVVIARSTPQAPVPAGTWDATVTDGTGCGNVLVGAFEVTDRLELGLASITPPFGYTGEDAPVVLHAHATATTTPARELFVRTPRAYLNPTSDPTAPATEMRSVAFVDDAVGTTTTSDTLTAVAPTHSANLPAGTYDVIAVNPDGRVGLLRGAFQVVSAPVPYIDTIVPGSITGGPGQVVEVRGANLRLDASCLNASGAEDRCVRLRCGQIGAAAPNILPPTVVTAASGTAATLRIDGSALGAGDVCAVRLTNADGTYADFSAITVANPSSGNNPIAFVSVPPLQTGRRAPAAVGARVTSTARFVYAIGGDEGSDATALATVEAAPVGLFGELGSWFKIPVDLPAPRTRAGVVRIGRFLYLVGGSIPGGSGPTTSVLRSMVLDPADAPAMGDPDLYVAREQTGSLQGGVYYYRVSALRPTSDPTNPGGETLASEPLVVRVPTVAGSRVTLRVSWLAQPGAVGYKLYRTPLPNQASGDERLLCTFGASQLDYTDDGDTSNDQPACSPDPNVGPLPLGSTSPWTDVFPDASSALVGRPLAHARSSAGVAVAVDRTSATTHHIYAVGGYDGSSYRNDYEHLTVEVLGPKSQQVSAAWVRGAQTLTARSELGVVVGDASSTSGLLGNVAIYALAGRTGASSGTGAVQVALLPSSGGELGAWDGTFSGPGQATVSGSPTGFSAAIANDAIYAIGGASNGGSSPSGAGTSRTLSVPSPNADAFASPWQSLGSINLRSRYLGGTAVMSGFIYVIGGTTDVAGGTCGDGRPDNPAATCKNDGSVLGGQP